MKKVITTLCVLLYATALEANHHLSDFTVRMHNSALFTVVLDNRSFNQLHREFSISDVSPGRHYISVYRVGNHALPVYSGFIDIPSASVVTAIVRAGHLHIVDSYPKQHYPACHHPLAVISNQEFNELKSIIRSKSFDSSKLAIARQAIRNRPMTSRQVAETLQLFSFDSSRLEFARYAYEFVVDPGTYYQTYNAFTFESSVNELIDFLALHS